jgi:hypothetical protein
MGARGHGQGFEAKIGNPAGASAGSRGHGRGMDLIETTSPAGLDPRDEVGG